MRQTAQNNPPTLIWVCEVSSSKQSNVPSVKRIFECLPAGWIVDHVEVGNRLARGFSEVQTQLWRRVVVTVLSPFPLIHIVALFRVIESLVVIWSFDSAAHPSIQGASRLNGGASRKPSQ
jgi:hypothetical protein